MAEISIAWTWDVLSPLHCGSGVSRAGFADKLVQRAKPNRDDPHSGTPIVPGEAVKGALRMSAEQILAWLGHPQLYYPDANQRPARTGTAEPRVPPLRWLFGGGADAHFTPAAYTSADGRPSSAVVSATRISPETGTALDDTLRSVEIVPPGGTLEARIDACVPDALAHPVVTLAVSALAATEQIGAKAGIGWGRVSIKTLRIVFDGKTLTESPEEAAAWITTAKLESLVTSLGAAASPMTPAATTLDLGERVWWEIDVTLEEPACFPTTPDVANRVNTEAGLRASVIRGALLRHWSRFGLTRVQRQACLGVESRWLPAFPVDPGSGTLLVPASRSHMGPKRQVKRSERRVIHDALVAEDGDSDGIPKKPLDGEWIDPASLGVAPAGKQMRMLVARHYLTGSHAPSALYARETLSAGTSFRTWALLPVGAWPKTSFEILLGKRTSAGNGRATVHVTRLPAGPPWPQPRSASTESRDVYVQLLSPAIVRGGHGHPLRTLLGADWHARVSAPVSIVPLNADRRMNRSAASTAPGRRGGWMSTWRHPRAAVATIDAGSSWRLRCADENDAGKLRQHLSELRQIGERQHEGFGWLAVDPEWLGGARFAGNNESQPPSPKTRPRPWPGTAAHFDHTVHAETTAIAARVAAKFPPGSEVRTELGDSRGALRQLAQVAREAGVSEGESLRTWCSEQADERKRRGWKALASGKPARGILDQHWSHPALLRFTLDALIVRATSVSSTEADHD